MQRFAAAPISGTLVLGLGTDCSLGPANRIVIKRIVEDSVVFPRKYASNYLRKNQIFVANR